MGSGALSEPLQSPSPDEVLSGVLALSRSVNLEMHEEEIVHAYVTAMQELCPKRLFAVRLFDSDSGELTLVYATGRLSADRRERIYVTRDALEQHGMLDAATGSPLTIGDAYTPQFQGDAQGFDVPIGDGQRVGGVLAVEYAPGVEPPATDPARIVPIALQMNASLRNARLLRESVYLRDYLGKLLDHANAPVLVLGRHRETKVVNRALVTLTGFTREELLGRDFMTLLPEEDRSRMLPVYINALRGKPSTGVEVRLPTRGQGHVRIAMNTAAILTADGDVEGVIAIGRDLTELRELQQRVIDAEKLATVGQMAAGVVHELNNPLTSISVYSNYLFEQAQNESRSAGELKKLKRISESAERILSFSRELLSYARPTPDEPALIEVSQLVTQAMEHCAHTIEECGADVSADVPGGLPPLFGVLAQLSQVLVNLITNACHAMPEGVGRLRIHASAGDDDTVVISVTDNGGGIAPDHMAKIFEPFFSTKGEGKGTGLGLSIVRNLVELHNGEIEVQSELGQGTTFRLTFVARAADGGALDD